MRKIAMAGFLGTVLAAEAWVASEIVEPLRHWGGEAGGGAGIRLVAHAKDWAGLRAGGLAGAGEVDFEREVVLLLSLDAWEGRGIPQWAGGRHSLRVVHALVRVPEAQTPRGKTRPWAAFVLPRFEGFEYRLEIDGKTAWSRTLRCEPTGAWAGRDCASAERMDQLVRTPEAWERLRKGMSGDRPSELPEGLDFDPRTESLIVLADGESQNVLGIRLVEARRLEDGSVRVRVRRDAFQSDELRAESTRPWGVFLVPRADRYSIEEEPPMFGDPDWDRRAWTHRGDLEEPKARDVTRRELETRSHVLRLGGKPARSVVVGARLLGLRVCLSHPDFREIVVLEEAQDRILWTAPAGDAWERLRLAERDGVWAVSLLEPGGKEAAAFGLADGRTVFPAKEAPRP